MEAGQTQEKLSLRGIRSEQDLASGTVAGIYIAPSAGKPMQLLEQVKALKGAGLEGDRYSRGDGYYSGRSMPDGGRQITLVETEVLEWLQGQMEMSFRPEESRRNLLTKSIQVNELTGKEFCLGEEVLCEGVSICEPCIYLEKLTGKSVMRLLVHRGGLRARVLVGGTIKVGDRIHERAETTGVDEPNVAEMSSGNDVSAP